MVDRIDPDGNGNFDRWDIGPMLLVFATGSDPTVEDVLFRIGEGFVGLGGRHDLLFVSGMDAVVDFAFLRFARRNGACAIVIGGGTGKIVEPQLGLAGFFVGAVAMEALVRQDGLDIAVEIDRLRHRGMEARGGGRHGKSSGNEEQKRGSGHGVSGSGQNLPPEVTSKWAVQVGASTPMAPLS